MKEKNLMEGGKSSVLQLQPDSNNSAFIKEKTKQNKTKATFHSDLISKQE